MSREANVHPDFLKFESKVDKISKMIDDLISSQKTEGERQTIIPSDLAHANLSNFIATTDPVRKVKPKSERLVCKGGDKISDSADSQESDLDELPSKAQEKPQSGRISKASKAESRSSIKEIPVTQLDKFTFMKQMEDDADKRYKQRRQREALAQQFRDLGNKHFHNGEYEAAVLMYTKAIEHVKDSPILYNNRAFAYIKLKNYKRALIDCDYVLNKLDERNLRSWMYRAAASKRNLDEQNYESSIRMAKEKNSKQHEIINEFVQKIETGDF